MSMLFTLSVICSANTIPLEQCAGGGYQPVGQCPRNNNYDSPNYYGGIAMDVQSGDWGTAYNYPTKKAAKEAAMSNCGSVNCKYVAEVINRGCSSIAFSNTDDILGVDTVTSSMFGSLGGIPESSSQRKKLASEKAMKKCEKKGGKNCKVVVSICGLADF